MMNEIVLYGTVGADFFEEDYFTAKDVREKLSMASGDITVRLNSGGGIATEGQAIYRALSDHPGKVTVLIDGAAASAASLIAMAGDEIIMPTGSWMLIHDPASMFTEGRGTADDHTKLSEMLNTIGDGYASIYAKRSGMTQEAAREIMRAETIYTPEAAVAAGFATAISEEQKAAAASPFPYQIYSNCPEGLQGSGSKPEREAVMASIVGFKPETKQKEPIMAVEKETAADAPAVEDEEVKSTNPEITVQEEEDTNKMEATAKAIEAERFRMRRLTQLGARMKIDQAEIDKMIDDGVTIEAAADKMLELSASAEGNHEIRNIAPRASTVRDASDRFAEGARKALMARAGLDGGERNEFSGMSLLEMARASMEVSGQRVSASSKLDVAGMAFGARMAGASHSTSDFPAILEDVANKSMLRGFDEQEETYQMWTSKGSMSDFKTGKRVGLDAFPALAEIKEDGEYSYGTMGDFAEPVVLGTYGKMFKITRQTIINDDLDAFTRIPARMGRAARRTIGNLAYAVLTGNPDMSDGTALFHADHNNLAGSGAAPSVTTLTAGIAAMATQKDRAEQVTALNIRPSYILAPYALRGTVAQLLESEYDPAKSTRAANTVRNAVTPIYDARLDTDSAAAWYLAASPSSGDTIEISYLDGNESPFLDSKDGWSIDGVEFKVRIDAAATPLAWEGLYKNAGS